MNTPTAASTNALVVAVKAHAQKNYKTGGWSMVIETMSDDEILREIGKARSTSGAIKAVEKVAALWEEARQNTEPDDAEFDADIQPGEEMAEQDDADVPPAEDAEAAEQAPADQDTRMKGHKDGCRCIGCRASRGEKTTPKVEGKAKAPKTANACRCGCGGSTGGRYQPGHDARHNALLRKAYEAGEMSREQALAQVTGQLASKLARSLDLADKAVASKAAKVAA